MKTLKPRGQELTFSEDHLSWECSAYLLAMYSSFSGREILEGGDNVYIFIVITKSIFPLIEQINTPGVHFQTTNLVVLMGLGSKLPCASIGACFSSVAPGLASTKSGGKAPAMAHKHDIAILKSSASYFYRRDKYSRKDGYKLPPHTPFSLQ